MKFSVITILAAAFSLLCLVDITHCDTDLNSTASSTFDNESTTMSVETSAFEEHPIRLQWGVTEKKLKKLASDMVKKIFPLLVRGSETMNLSAKCSRSLIKMLTGLKQLKLWAFRMLDASGKLPNGILSGTLSSLGDFDGCLKVDVPGQFLGQYCTLDVITPLPERRPFYPVDLVVPELLNLSHPSSLVTELLRNSQHYYYLNFRSSVCLPSTCSREEVQQIAHKVMDDIGIGWGVQVPNCEVKEPVVLETNEIVIICILGIIAFTALSGTLLDVYLKLTSQDESYRNDSGVFVRILLCFSVYSNTNRLLKKDDSPDTIKIFHGMKVLTVMWVILNHTYFYINFQACGALLTARTMGTEVAFQLVANGFLNVETFFFISSVLVVYGRMKSKEKNFNIGLYIFRRIWRLTPPFMLIIATSYLIPHIGSGPVWRETVGAMVDKCKANWWTNLLYINNFIPSAEMCFQWMWYIPVDTHLYLLAIVVLIPIKSRPRLGFVMIAILLAAGTISTVVSNIYYGLHPTAIYAFPHPDDINYYVQHGYFKTHLHISTYCVGMVVGYILSTKQKMRIPVVFNIFGWLIAFTMALLVLYGVYDWNQGNTPNLAVSTLYTCTNKFVWSLSLAWVTTACFTGNGGIATSILSWSAFVPLSRLTYVAYLIHPVIQHMFFGSTRELIRTEHRTFVFLYFGHLVAAFMSAYFFSLLFESPFMALEKVMFSGHRQAKSQDIIKVKENGKINHSFKNEENGIYAINIRKTEDMVQ